jgi:hypothetical protein
MPWQVVSTPDMRFGRFRVEISVLTPINFIEDFCNTPLSPPWKILNIISNDATTSFFQILSNSLFTDRSII